MRNNSELAWAITLLNKIPDVIVSTVDSFYHGDSYWYDTEFEATLYPQNGFSIYLCFKSFPAQYRFYRRFRHIESESEFALPRGMQLTLTPCEKDIWLLQLKYRWRENINDQLFAYWNSIITALSQHHDD